MGVARSHNAQEPELLMSLPEPVHVPPARTRAPLPAAQPAGRPAVKTNTGLGAAPVQAPPIMVAPIVPSPLAPAAPSTSVQGRA